MIDSKNIIKYAFTNKDIDNQNVYLLGASMGGATSIYSSSYYQDKLKGLILMNTFTSLPEVVDNMNIILRIFRPLVLNNYWPSEKRIKVISLPILFISGDSDEMIPPSQMDRLFKSAATSKFKRMYKVKGGEHNDTW